MVTEHLGQKVYGLHELPQLAFRFFELSGVQDHPL